MSAFTMRLHEVIELEKDQGDGWRLGLNDYPVPSFWTDDDRAALNAKIIRHYYMREIGQESISMFRYTLRARMWELMPPYVQLYESTKLEFDPISSVLLKTSRSDSAEEDVTRTSEGSSNSNSTADGSTVNLNAPNTALSGNESYADTGVKTGSESSTSGENSGTDTGKTTNSASGESSTSGYQGSPSDLLAKYRSTILNIDMMIVTDLADCFFLVLHNTVFDLPDARGYLY